MGAAILVYVAVAGLTFGWRAVCWVQGFDRHYAPPQLTILREWAGFTFRSAAWPVVSILSAIGGTIEGVQWLWAYRPLKQKQASERTTWTGPKTCEHNWLEVTYQGCTRRQYLCSKCGEEKTGNYLAFEGIDFGKMPSYAYVTKCNLNGNVTELKPAVPVKAGDTFTFSTTTDGAGVVSLNLETFEQWIKPTSSV